MSTNPEHYYEPRRADEQPRATGLEQTWINREAELLVYLLGCVAFGLAAGIVLVGLWFL